LEEIVKSSGEIEPTSSVGFRCAGAKRAEVANCQRDCLA
jgi:hypothetical protein